MLGCVDDERTDALALVYPYFEHAEPLTFDAPGTYVPTDVAFTHNATRQWSHGLGEIVTALLDVGLEISMLVEHDSVPWDALPGRMTEDDGEWRLTEFRDRLPLSYTLQAVKPPTTSRIQESSIRIGSTSTAEPHCRLTSASQPGLQTMRTGSNLPMASATAA